MEGAAAVAVAPSVSCFRDTCNVYVLRAGTDAILVDFGDGDVLDQLAELGVERVTDVLLTHHHRDQLGGLERAAEAGIRIWAPPNEVELIAGMDERWGRRQIANDYDLRQDRFSLLQSVPVTGAVAEYRTRRYGAFDVYALPTPGHTMGSVTYLVELDGRSLAFTGDLVHEDGKVWSLAASQWTYSGVEGWAATVLSCHLLSARAPDLLLPSHGDAIEEPADTLMQVADRLQDLIDLRLPTPWNLAERVREPFDPVTPHLLRNRTMFANSYVLTSETGAALVLDFGYDLTGTSLSTERAARRTLLWSVEALKRDRGVERIDAAIVTHYHDDHVAGLNLLREVEGAEIWAPEHIAPVLEQPSRYDLPCLWFDPIRVDRTLVLGSSFRWHEYEIGVHPLPGHTRYAAAIAIDVDGKRVLFTGDEQSIDRGRAILNFQYRNRFEPDDFVQAFELYERLRPDVILGGHWLPLDVTDELLETLLADARRTAELHRELLPEEGFGTDGFPARIEPYRATGPEVDFTVGIRNPFARDETAAVRLVVPTGWTVTPPVREVELGPHGDAEVEFRVVATGAGRVAADLTVGEARFGQQAEALVERG